MSPLAWFVIITIAALIAFVVYAVCADGCRRNRRNPHLAEQPIDGYRTYSYSDGERREGR